MRLKIQKFEKQNGRLMLLSKCAMCKILLSKFIKDQKASQLLISLGIKTYLKNVQSPFKDNIWGSDLAVMQLISESNKGTCFLLYAIDISGKYVWVIALKDAKHITITNIRKNIFACLFIIQ